MNHKLSVLAAAALALLLCACGTQDEGGATPPETSSPAQVSQSAEPFAPQESEPAEDPTPSEDPTPPEDPEPPEDPVPPEPPEEPNIPEDLETGDARETAVSLIGSSVEDLYAAIGEPSGSDYAPSCLGSGEDGELFYDGFTVYTYREGNTETVEDVL